MQSNFIPFRRASILMFTCLFFIVTDGCLSQRQRPVRQPAWSGCNLLHTFPIVSAPPYNTDMPLDVILTYMVIDSLARNSIVDSLRLYSLLDQVIKDSIGTEKELKDLLKYLYLIKDYDDLLFSQFVNAGWFVNSKYLTPPFWITEAFTRICFNILKQNSKEFFISFASGIYDVEIVDVWTDGTKRSDDPSYGQAPITCLKVRVVESLKGRRLPSICNVGITRSSQSDTCMQLSYTNEWKTIYIDEYNSDFDVYTDSLGNERVYPPIYGQVHQPSVGDRYLIFLRLETYDFVDSTGVPYLLFPLGGFQYEGGMFPIKNEFLIDSSNYFGQGNSVYITVFKQWLSNFINQQILGR